MQCPDPYSKHSNRRLRSKALPYLYSPNLTLDTLLVKWQYIRLFNTQNNRRSADTFSNQSQKKSIAPCTAKYSLCTQLCAYIRENITFVPCGYLLQLQCTQTQFSRAKCSCTVAIFCMGTFVLIW